MRKNMTRLGLMAGAAAVVFALTPTAVFGQRGTSSRADEPAASESAPAVQPAPQTMQRREMQRDRMQDDECAGMHAQRAQRGQMQGRQGRGQGMQAGAELTERERLERMREHMVAGMRRMATRLTAVQDRILALDRGEPDAAPPVEMGRGMRAEGGQGMQMQGQGMQGQRMQGQRMRGSGMQMRDGSGPECIRTQPATGDDSDTTSSGMDR